MFWLDIKFHSSKLTDYGGKGWRFTQGKVGGNNSERQAGVHVDEK